MSARKVTEATVRRKARRLHDQAHDLLRQIADLAREADALPAAERDVLRARLDMAAQAMGSASTKLAWVDSDIEIARVAS
jgi:hypothetical protein